MQSIKCSRAFTTARPVGVRPCVSVAPRPFAQRYVEVAVRAAAAATDVEEYMDEVDVASTPLVMEMAGEKVRLRVRMRSYEKNLLERCVSDIMFVAQTTGAEVKGPVMLPTKRRIYCVLRSPHVNKDAREHFEVRTHHRLVDLRNLSSETVSMMMEWVPPAGAPATQLYAAAPVPVSDGTWPERMRACSVH
jgi:small subunit ribosomal protein S10